VTHETKAELLPEANKNIRVRPSVEGNAKRVEWHCRP
jgi:hypothetical protein